MIFDNLNKIDWIKEALEYYKYLPYHDEVNIIIDGKHIVIPKKTGLPIAAAKIEATPAHTYEHTNGNRT